MMPDQFEEHFVFPARFNPSFQVPLALLVKICCFASTIKPYLEALTALQHSLNDDSSADIPYFPPACDIVKYRKWLQGTCLAYENPLGVPNGQQFYRLCSFAYLIYLTIILIMIVSPFFFSSLSDTLLPL
jgi:hypothetical protein